MSENIGFTKTDLGDATDQSMENFVRNLVRCMFMNDAISSILQIQLDGTSQDSQPIVELEVRLRSVNGKEIKLEETDNGS